MVEKLNGKPVLYGADGRSIALVFIVMLVIVWVVLYLIFTLLWGDVLFLRIFFAAAPLTIILCVAAYFGERQKIQTETLASKEVERLILKEQEELSKYEQVTKLKVSRSFFSTDRSGYIIVDEQSGKVSVKQNDKIYTADLGAVLGIEVRQDDVPVLGSPLKTVAGGTAVGGLLFGETGAIAGAMLAQSSNVIKRVSLELTISLDKLVDLELLLFDGQITSGGLEHRKISEKAEKCASYLGHAIDDWKRKTQGF